MTSIKKKQSNNKIIEYFKNPSILNGAGILTVKSKEAKDKLQKIDNIFKLVYKLFIYSVFGFFVKILNKFFR